MTTRDKVKAELDKVEDQCLEVVHRLIVSLEVAAGNDTSSASWSDFIAASYGSTANAPIERGEQGALEVRALFE